MVPDSLVLKAEALQLANRTSGALEAIKEGETLAQRTEGRRIVLQNCTGFKSIRFHRCTDMAPSHMNFDHKEAVSGC